jgi:hypothetical protein
MRHTPGTVVTYVASCSANRARGRVGPTQHPEACDDGRPTQRPEHYRKREMESSQEFSKQKGKERNVLDHEQIAMGQRQHTAADYGAWIHSPIMQSMRDAASVQGHVQVFCDGLWKALK